MTADDLAKCIGEDAALHLMARKGGLRIYAPKQVTPALVAICGCERAASRLSSAYGGLFLVLPVAKRWRMRRLKERGLSAQQIALALGVTEQAVFRCLSETGRQHEQAGPADGKRAA